MQIHLVNCGRKCDGLAVGLFNYANRWDIVECSSECLDKNIIPEFVLYRLNY